MTTPRRIGMRLRQLRLRKGLTQAIVAKKAGITREYVNKLEAGRYDPTVGVLKRLARVVGVPLTELLRDR
jgi:transcriptional regulator with XRE-family HTH domain